jgi:hypothetical protein
MFKRLHIALLVSMVICGIGSAAQAQQQLCPGQNNMTKPTNLACEIADASGAAGVQGSLLSHLPSAIASQFGQLPLSTAISGSGLTLNRSLGVFTASEDSLGTIFTQRAETMGKGKFLVAFSYQHFGFGSIDGISLKDLQTTQQVPNSSAYIHANNDISLSVDQYTVMAGFGLSSRVDLALVLPISRVGLDTTSRQTYYEQGASPTPIPTNVEPGSASKIGDFAVNLKANLIKGEKTSFAAGTEVRFRTGDASNFLGSGAYGIKPYIVISRHGRLTPNVNIAYQWNGNSILANGQNLPHSLLYSGGVDYRVTRKFTLVAEFVGQQVRNGWRVALVQSQIPSGAGTATVPLASVNPYQARYYMDNLGGGFKANLTKNLFVNASVLFKLDEAGLRSNVIPLAGASYRF